MKKHYDEYVTCNGECCPVPNPFTASEMEDWLREDTKKSKAAPRKSKSAPRREAPTRDRRVVLDQAREPVKVVALPKTSKQWLNLEEIREEVDRCLSQFGLSRYTVGHVFFEDLGGRVAEARAWLDEKTGLYTKNPMEIVLNSASWAQISPSDRLETIRHETAHIVDFANTKPNTKPDLMHGRVWQAYARQLGSSGEACVVMPELVRNPDGDGDVAAVTALFAKLSASASKAFRGPVRLVLDDEMALAGRTSPKDVHRARASAEVDDAGVGTIYIAEALLSDPSARQRGVLSHELGHVFLLQHGIEEHTERQADAAAEELFGKQINYDADDIQTTGPGTHPRPKRLDVRSNPGGAGGCCLTNPVENPILLRSDAEAARYGELVADAYAAAPAFDVEAVWRWELLIEHIEVLYKRIQRGRQGVKIVRVAGQPYADAEELQAGIEKTGILYVSTDFNTHPVFTAEQNLKFRAVHDYMTHVGRGVNFGMRGEIAAFNAHAKMVPPEAVPALFTEVLGQAATFIARGHFPEQKIALLPFDYYNVGVEVAGRGGGR